MKARLLFILISVCSLNFAYAEIVPGFTVSETYSPSGISTFGSYLTGGEGGNWVGWTVQNQADVATDLTPNISVDGSLKSDEEVRLLAYQTETGEYEINKSNRTKPYEWEINFEFSWSSDDALVKRKYWINAYANDWNSEEYKDVWSRGKR